MSWLHVIYSNFIQHHNSKSDKTKQLTLSYTQARSQDLEKGGGLFWKSEKCANDLDSNFHWPWISFRRFVRNLRRNVSERSEIQRFFPPKIRWSPKNKKKQKKKGLRQNSEWFFGRNPKKKRSSPKFRVIFRPKSKIQRVFPPKIRWSPKKKKRSSPKFRAIFLPKFRKFKRLRGGSCRMGGAIFHFLQKIGLKSTKNMRFCILHKPMGGLEPPPRLPPGYATGYTC